MYCKKCQVHIKTDTKECPLCKKSLVEDDIKTVESYPNMKDYRLKKRMIGQILTFFCVIGSALCGIINWITYNGTLWSLIVIASSLFALISFRFMFKPGFNIGKYLTFLSIGIPVLLILIEIFQGKNNFQNPTWSLDYTLPLILTFGLLLMTILMASSKKLFSDCMIYLFLLCIANCLMAIRLDNTVIIWPIIVSILSTVFVICFIVVFFWNRLKEEMIKKFHY